MFSDIFRQTRLRALTAFLCFPEDKRHGFLQVRGKGLKKKMSKSRLHLSQHSPSVESRK